ncbi:hypothetical protein D9758_013192 [Tetrapyrgos nigripes]|uniref:Uncharacterized protein n=1 Tax=Tetrapyrgos nigripes TaxID=182062 RepID=A0A8H5CSM2_9AGAR|nr:hypothetical protein D9758_013192 [Tetrapyrgos nigripes]
MFLLPPPSLPLPYRWYQRIEHDVHFHSDLTFDPFVWMEDNEKGYAFTITMYELERTIPILWEVTKGRSGFYVQTLPVSRLAVARSFKLI